MLSNKLKCNAEKTEMIVITPSRSASLGQVSVSIGGMDIQGRDCIRTLGVHQDNRLTMERHVNQLTCIYEDRLYTLLLDH